MDIRRAADELIKYKLATAKAKAEQLENAPTEREKFQWTQQKDIRSEEFEHTKFMVNKFLEQHNRLTTDIERKILYGQAQTWIAGLNPEMRTVVNSLVDLTPLSPMQKKVLDYRSIHKPMTITADYEKAPNSWASQAFQQTEDDFQFRSFLGEQNLTRRDTIVAPDNTVFYRNPDNGIVTHIDESAKQGLAALATVKKSGMTLEQVEANGGNVPLQDFTQYSDGQKDYLVRPVHNIFNNTITKEKIEIGRSTTEAPWKLPESGQNILGYLRMNTDDLRKMKDPVAFAVADYQTKRISLGKNANRQDINKLLKETLGPLAPGINMAIKKPSPNIDKGWFFKSYDEETDEYLTMWPGVKTMFQSGTPGIRIPVWYDSDSGTYWYGPDFLGSEDDAINWALGQHPGKETK